VGDQHERQPHLVVLEVAEGQVLQAGVLVVADVVLDASASAVATLKDGDVAGGLVGEDRLEAIAVMVGEGELRAGVRRLPDDHARALRPSGEIKVLGDLCDLPVGALSLGRRDRRAGPAGRF